ncbi:MAG: MFS transporter [Christensenellaceae bacterium]|jgi:MFS family permease
MKTKEVSRKTYAFFCCVSMLVIGIQVAGYQYILLDIADGFSLNLTGMGALASAQFLPNMIAPLLFGGLVDKKNKKTLMLLCICAYALGSLVILFSSGVVFLVVGIVILGSGGALMPTILTVMLAEQNPAESAFYANLVEVFYSAGTVVAPPLIALLMGLGMQWKGLYAIVVVLAILLFLLHLFLKTPSVPQKPLPHAAEQGGLKAVLTPVGILLIVFGGVYCAVEGGFCNFLTPYFKEGLGADTQASLALSMIGIAMVVVRLATAKINKHKEMMVVFSCLFGGVAALLMILVPGKNSSFLWSILFGIAVAPAWPFMMSTAVDAFPHNAGRMTTLIMVGNGLGGMLVSPVMGFLSDHFGVIFSYSFVVLTALVAAGCFFWIRKLRKAGESALFREKSL